MSIRIPAPRDVLVGQQYHHTGNDATIAATARLPQEPTQFHFRGDLDDYPALLTKYEENTKNVTSDKEYFNILYRSLEGEPEKMYN